MTIFSDRLLLKRFALGLWLALQGAAVCLAEPWVLREPAAGAFALAGGETTARIAVGADDFPVVVLAARDLARDLERVSGRAPEVSSGAAGPGGPVVYVGTLGQSARIDTLAREGKLELGDLDGAWESFVIATVASPEPGVSQGLVIAGSDRRGTAFGVYELSQAIGVSPWHWWADVSPPRAEALYVSEGLRRFGPPSVKYRGIFINDEDWGLHPWASHTFDPELGDIGPKTYERVFELMLRLKANTLWPAMHEVTQAFNLYPENKELADRYAIVMASSHAEPMLRNNVTEWTAPQRDYNYATNRDGVRAYWEQRVKENADYENIYSLGMRGIHDSGMVAGRSTEEQVAFLERIFTDQRDLLREHVGADLSRIPQAFTPYKEVLELYQAGLTVPEEVTIVWPNDNHGYIRRFPSASERTREGGSGVYYHLSYLGSPMAYLWLYTTPPALVWQEMSKAYALGAQEYWIVNVGDIKPAEMGMEFFLQMAWDIERWNLDTLPRFFETWAAREFGEEASEGIAEIFEVYFELNYQRRPEHLQWWLPHQRAQGSDLTAEEVAQRLAAFDALVEASERAKVDVRDGAGDAFFQLVEYPVKASAFANRRYFHLEQYGRLFNADPRAAAIHGALAREANSELKGLTAYYNEELAEGKWRRFMAEEPADNMWRSYRLIAPLLPAPTLVAQLPISEAERSGLRFAGASDSAAAQAEVEREAESFERSQAVAGVEWKVVPGLGRTGDSIAAYPVSQDSFLKDGSLEEAPWVEYSFEVVSSGDYRFYSTLIPTYPVAGGRDLRFAVSVGDQEPTLVSLERETGDAAWKQAVLSGSVTANATLEIDAPGRHRLRLWVVDAGVVVDKWFLHQGELAPRFLGPDL